MAAKCVACEGSRPEWTYERDEWNGTAKVSARDMLGHAPEDYYGKGR